MSNVAVLQATIRVDKFDHVIRGLEGISASIIERGVVKRMPGLRGEYRFIKATKQCEEGECGKDLIISRVYDASAVNLGSDVTPCPGCTRRSA